MKERQNLVGPVLRDLREKKGLSQAQLVAKLNILGWDLSRATFSKIEAQIRCVTDYEIPVLAASVGVEPSELLMQALEKFPKGRRFVAARKTTITSIFPDCIFFARRNDVGIVSFRYRNAKNATKILGQFIRSKRDELDMSLRELACQLDITPPFLSDIELGKRYPSEPVMAKLAGFLNTG